MTTSQTAPALKDTAADVLGPLQAKDDRRLATLHSRLVADAAAGGLLDVAYSVIDSPIGPLLLAGTDAGLVRVAFETEDHAGVLDTLASGVSPRVLHAPDRMAAVAAQLDEYFAGARRRFDVRVDFRLAPGFRQRVLMHLPEIAYGRTESYAEVARAVGSPRAVRAAGTACGRNPLPVVVPCHRVVRSDGSLGGYAGGPDVKRFLLDLERVA